jgi:hypothetical protein
MNGFDLTNSLIPTNEILSGGPPKDGIPSVDKPVFEDVGISAIKDDDAVLGVIYNGVAKAYPIAIMNWHEIVNDYFGDEPVVVTYCPLCGSGIAYPSTIKGERTEFGVSGLLYNSDVLLYDRNTNSLWSQIRNEAVSGPQKGEKLSPISTQHTTFGAWKKIHPDTQVLSTNTGFGRDYTQSPYAGYDTSDNTFFPVVHMDERLSKKEWVIGIEYEGVYKAYPRALLQKSSSRTFEDTLPGGAITLSWDDDAQNVIVTDSKGEQVPSFVLFWFAWASFHPDTEILSDLKTKNE